MATFLLEVGTEELPASFVTSALAQWQKVIPAVLGDRYLLDPATADQHVKVYGTPRRLAVVISGLPDRQPDRTLEAKGPALAAAFVDDKPTKAAIGFARSRGVDIADLEIKETAKGKFIFALQEIIGQPTTEILAELAPSWITDLEGPRQMRWGDRELKFTRPIRWLVALFDQKILPLELEGLTSDRCSRGHRVLHPRDVIIDTAADYAATLKEAFVIADVAERKQLIQIQIKAVTELIAAKAEIPDSLLDEVNQLVEWPTAVVGNFDAEFLNLPAEVIKTEMISHQRYFPMNSLEDPTQLMPYFITISNGNPEKSRLIADGNGRVIRARLADGKFFYDADRQHPLETFLPRLSTVTFQEKLGSVAQKVERIRAIATAVVDATANLELAPAEQKKVDRTAQLCKADLVSQMVYEFPELQGVMGQYYAQASGEDQLVAQGIMEHYLPRGAGDDLPQSLTGKLVAISDRLDTLVGIYGIGIIPSGSRDPFALRRAATGVVQIAWDSNLAIDLTKLLPAVIEVYAKQDVLTEPTEKLLSNLYHWFQQRCDTLLQEAGVDYDLVNAVFGDKDPEYATQALTNLALLRDRALFLQQARQDKTLDGIYEVVNRATKLATQGDLATDLLRVEKVVDQTLLSEPAEQELFQAIAQLPADPSFDQLLASIVAIAPTLAKFFDHVLVMVEDEKVKQNRLNMLGIIRNYSRILADFSAIVSS
ncbi:glycyl-tRNA synthetase beta chain [Thalassoporum mexicanum PCC 7367]|uniref:glycine--tRNA ligase subunit beta n=1 Tax=Thalassoporum mexicanum TaxID=3457544 RepID=UPI00029FF869|nr:glycine--tRNA ligase subunit beta [Pseudanabaena sp. PCC 7367]AFY70905.1 glycyl-tRNA synthetase beta chain [Pseudanabaena sp. PCC 7367]